MTDKEFCDLYTEYYGEKLTNIKQLVKDVYTGEELKEIIEYFIKETKNNQNETK